MRKCVECYEPINPDSLTFEQKLVEDTDWCSKCWTRIMTDSFDELSYLDNPRFVFGRLGL
jgi:hypothetical protein